MTKVFLTRRMTFSAAHRLHSADLSDAQNRALFGKCNGANGHGHNYVVEVTVAGPVDPHSGIVFNLADLKSVMADTIEKEFDHTNLNVDVPAFAELNPTVENIAVVIWQMLEPRLPPGLLHEVTVTETENNRATYRG